MIRFISFHIIFISIILAVTLVVSSVYYSEVCKALGNDCLTDKRPPMHAGNRLDNWCWNADGSKGCKSTGVALFSRS